MKRGRSTGAATRAESDWIDAVKRRGCVCCISLGMEHDPDGPVVEAHHLLSGGIRRGHLHTIGLCQWHHRGRLLIEGFSHADHRAALGPALSEGSVPFHEAFGSDVELMGQQRALLNLPPVAV